MSLCWSPDPFPSCSSQPFPWAHGCWAAISLGALYALPSLAVTHYSIPLWALLRYLDIPVTTPVRIESRGVRWSEPRSVPSCMGKSLRGQG